MRKFIGLAAVFRAMRVHTINFRREYVDYLAEDLPAAEAVRRRVLADYPALTTA